MCAVEVATQRSELFEIKQLFSKLWEKHARYNHFVNTKCVWKGWLQIYEKVTTIRLFFPGTISQYLCQYCRRFKFKLALAPNKLNYFVPMVPLISMLFRTLFYHSFGSNKVKFRSPSTRQLLVPDVNHLLVAEFGPKVTGSLVMRLAP